MLSFLSFTLRDPGLALWLLWVLVSFALFFRVMTVGTIRTGAVRFRLRWLGIYLPIELHPNTARLAPAHDIERFPWEREGTSFQRNWIDCSPSTMYTMYDHLVDDSFRHTNIERNWKKNTIEYIKKKSKRQHWIIRWWRRKSAGHDWFRFSVKAFKSIHTAASQGWRCKGNKKP